jgi:hypothetical protein
MEQKSRSTVGAWAAIVVTVVAIVAGISLLIYSQYRSDAMRRQEVGEEKRLEQLKSEPVLTDLEREELRQLRERSARRKIEQGY